MAHWCLLVTVCMLLEASILCAQDISAQIGQIKVMTGQVYIVRDHVQKVAQAGDMLQQSDTVLTGDASSVGITFIDDSRFSAGPHSRIELEQFLFNPTTHDGMFSIKIARGTLAVISGNIAKRSENAMQVRTPTTILGVRGTKFLVKVDE